MSTEGGIPQLTEMLEECSLPEDSETLDCAGIASAFKYAYTPITTQATTRMLILHNGGYEDELAGHLEMTNLDDGNLSPWKALSYAWGTQTTHTRIRIGQKFIQISTNLEHALRRLRNDEGHDDEPKQCMRLWVDQICINQEDIPERSQQVQLMYRIYEKAERVVVWLGPDHDAIAKKAFFTLGLFASLDVSQLRMIRDGDAGNVAPLLGQLKVLFDLPWFYRLWIIQEVGTQTPTIFYWGQERIFFDTLYQACLAIRDELGPMRYDLKVRSHFGYRLYQSFFEGRPRRRSIDWDFVYHLYRFNVTAGTKCLDPRDRQINVPSWIPNWEPQKRCSILSYGAECGAAGNRPLVVHVTKPQYTLQIQGFVVDIVDRFSRPIHRADCYDVHPDPASNTNHILVEIWNEICGHSVFDLATPYHVLGSSALVAFLDTCRAGQNRPFYITDPGDCSAILTPPKRTLDGIAFLCQALPSSMIDPTTGMLASKGKADRWLNSFNRNSRKRRFAKTACGYYALGPQITEKGDLVAVLMGYETPFILRPVGVDEFLLVGECCVHGIMQGQALSMLEKGEAVLRDFNIL
ncbi:heterokaryon incompatibility protein-domain-containing protein [Apiospora kogelbergensis]|uniref:heterokaryon incompatibility protein-domain-containing protein n=1 Tax=Apiospora kogelbergensis TaxID=1337665 RepID=UPI0031300EFB